MVLILNAHYLCVPRTWQTATRRVSRTPKGLSLGANYGCI